MIHQQFGSRARMYLSGQMTRTEGHRCISSDLNGNPDKPMLEYKRFPQIKARDLLFKQSESNIKMH